MGRRHFLMTLGKFVGKYKVRQMCEKIELTEEETKLLLARFCDGCSIDQTADYPHYVSPDRQYRLLTQLEPKIIGWYLENRDFFTKKQQDYLDEWL